MSIRKHGSAGDQQASVEPQEQPEGTQALRREASTERPLDTEDVRSIVEEDQRWP